MTDTIVKVENLSKSFIISHEGKDRYESLRDVIAGNVRNLLQRRRRDNSLREEFWALRDVNFEIKRGDRVGIIGRNGAGKSTLLKILSRITEPTKGRIEINGRVASLLEVGTGFHPELTGRENIFLNGAILGMSRAEIRKKFDEIVAFAEVEKFLDTPVKRYSSGMYVRLAFAVAAHLEPEILIVDEVLAVGDAQFQKKCLGKMEEVSKNEGRTVLFVSHNMGLMSQFCNTAILLEKGRLISQGSARSVIQYYVKDAEFVGSYQASTYQTTKRNFFTEIFSSTVGGQRTTEFSFDENMVINFSFVMQERSNAAQVGIGFNDKNLTRVFTVLKPVDFFESSSDQVLKGKVILPSNLVAPGSYSITVALWTKDGQVFDLVENVNKISIHDSGTEMSLYHGLDYGSIIVNADWQND